MKDLNTFYPYSFISKFVTTVSIIFRNCRMPEDKHRDNGLRKSLAYAVELAYQEAREKLTEIAEVYMDKSLVTPEVVEKSRVWKKNREYLNYKYNKYQAALGTKQAIHNLSNYKGQFHEQ